MSRMADIKVDPVNALVEHDPEKSEVQDNEYNDNITTQCHGDNLSGALIICTTASSDIRMEMTSTNDKSENSDDGTYVKNDDDDEAKPLDTTGDSLPCSPSVKTSSLRTIQSNLPGDAQKNRDDTSAENLADCSTMTVSDQYVSALDIGGCSCVSKSNCSQCIRQSKCKLPGNDDHALDCTHNCISNEGLECQAIMDIHDRTVGIETGAFSAVTDDEAKCVTDDRIDLVQNDNNVSKCNEAQGLLFDIPKDSQMQTVETDRLPDNEVADTKSKSELANMSESVVDESLPMDAVVESLNTVSHEEPPRRRRVRDSSISDSDEFDSDKSAASSDSNDKNHAAEDDEFVRRFPPNQWQAVTELFRRQVGSSNRRPTSGFRERIQGSLRMVQRLSLMHKMEYHQGCVNALNFNRIGTLLASGSDDLNIVLWNWLQNKPALIYDSGHRGNVFQAKFMPFSGDCHIVSCARDGQVRLAELSLTGVCKATKKVAQHKSPAHKLALEYDSAHTFLSCGEDGNVIEIDLREDKPERLLCVKESGRRVPLYSIHTNPNSSVEFCVSGLDQFIRVYDKRKIASEDASIIKYCPHHLLNTGSKANVTCACYNYNGTEIVGTYNDDNVYLFRRDHSSGAEYTHKYEGHRNNSTVKGVNFYGPKSEYVISGSDCGNIYFWDKETESLVQYLHADDTGVVNVSEPHPFAPILATSGLDSDVKVWAPIAQDATNLAGIHKVTSKNKKNREYQQSNDPHDLIDSQILLFLMRQSAHHSRRESAANNDDTSSNEDNTDDDDEDAEDRDDGLNRVHLLGDQTRCAPS